MHVNIHFRENNYEINVLLDEIYQFFSECTHIEK